MERFLAMVVAATVGLGLVGRASAEDYDFSPGSAAAPEGAEAPAPAADEGGPWALSFDFTYNSKYVWRGIDVTEDPVFQPSVTVGYEGLSMNVWANIDTTDTNDFEWQALEIDYTLDYSFSYEMLNFSVGGIHYQFPQAHVFDTTEVYAGVGLDVLTAPTLTVYQDLDEHDGTYVVLAFSHSFADVWQPAENVSMSVDLATSFAWGSEKHNEFYYAPGVGSGFADGTVSVGLPFQIGEKVTLTPAASYAWFFDDDLGAVGNRDAFWAGLTLGVSF